LKYRFTLSFVCALSFLQILIFSSYGQRLNGDSLKKLLTNKQDTTELRILNQLSETYRADSSKSILYGEKALSMAYRLSETRGTIIALKNIGIAYGFKNDYAHAIEYLLQSSELAEKNGDKRLAASNYMNVGSAYSVSSNYEMQLRYYLKALKLYEEIGDRKGVGSITYGIGIVYVSTGQHELALENYIKAAASFIELKDNKELAKVYINFGALYYKRSEFENALNYYAKAFELFKTLAIPRGMASALASQGEIFLKEKKYNEAESVLNESLRLNRLSNHQFAVAHCLISLAEVALAREKFAVALEYLNRALELEKKIRSKEDLSNLYLQLSKAYKWKGNFKLAFGSYQLHKTYSDSVFSIEKSKQLQELQVKYDLDKKEASIQLLQKDNEIKKLSINRIVLSAITLLLLTGLIVVRQRLKIKKDKLLMEQQKRLHNTEHALTKAELNLSQIKEEELKKEIEYKNKSLTTYALSMVQKNEILEEVRESVELILKKPDNHEEHFKKLSKVVDYSFSLEKDWDEFKIYFEDVHSDFFVKLRERFPDLGGADLKLCSLIRLNLNMKQSAAILRISPDSVKVARHRLRKKFNMQTEDNLNGFIMAL
jgi:tetratricopeptide (TPR) repeat protein